MVVLEPPMSSPHQLVKMVDKQNGVYVVVSCGLVITLAGGFMGTPNTMFSSSRSTWLEGGAPRD